ncbi:DegV family protein [Paenibacillus sp. TRM 82003]|nr:DegV family protein [Paenibacillus sp. TRM 82003]
MPVHIITDGSSDLPISIIEAWNIRIVPLGVHFGEKTYDSNIETSEFYRLMRTEPELPKTSSPSPHAFVEAFKGVPQGEPILVIALSSALSSTYQHASLAKEMFREEHPEAGEIEVIDSRTASSGLGGIVYQAAKRAKDGWVLQELAAYVNELLLKTRTYFVLNTLENVIKGGRLDRVRGAVASMLNIKLLMRANEQGAVEVMEKVRGTSAAVKRMLDRLEEVKEDAASRLLAVAHSNCEERARELVKTIKERYPFRDIIVSNMGPVIGTYAGEGGLLISYSTEEVGRT